MGNLIKKFNSFKSFINENAQEGSPYAISYSDGHDETWEYYETYDEAAENFEKLKKTETDMHLYEYNEELGYEVIDYYLGEEE